MGPQDYFGREIRVGDWLVYPTRQSSSLYMQASMIEKITLYDEGNYRLTISKEPGGRTWILNNYHLGFVLPEGYNIDVRDPGEDSWDRYEHVLTLNGADIKVLR